MSQHEDASSNMYNFLARTVASYLHPSFKEIPVSQIELEAEQYFETSKPISMPKPKQPTKTEANFEKDDPHNEEDDDEFKHYKQDVLLRQRAVKKLSSSAPAATSYLSQQNFTNMQYRNFSHHSHYLSTIENSKQNTQVSQINNNNTNLSEKTRNTGLEHNLTSNTPLQQSSTLPSLPNGENRTAWNQWFVGTIRNEQELDNSMEQSEIEDFSKQILDLNTQSKSLQFESKERQKYQQVLTNAVDEEVAKLRQKNKTTIKE